MISSSSKEDGLSLNVLLRKMTKAQKYSLHAYTAYYRWECVYCCIFTQGGGGVSHQLFRISGLTVDHADFQLLLLYNFDWQLYEGLSLKPGDQSKSISTGSIFHLSFRAISCRLLLLELVRTRPSILHCDLLLTVFLSEL